MGIVSKGETDTEWDLDHQEMISHDKEITGILKINDEIMATHSSEDKSLKIWCINEEGCECLYSFKTSVLSMEYDNHSKTLAIMDSDLKLGLFKRDFSKKEEEESEMPVKQAVAEEKVSEINMEDFEMINLEDDDIEYKQLEEKQASIVEEVKQS